MGIFEIVLIVAGIYQIVISLLINTSNIRSGLIFKIVPFFSGCYCIFYALKVAEIIKIMM